MTLTLDAAGLPVGDVLVVVVDLVVAATKAVVPAQIQATHLPSLRNSDINRSVSSSEDRVAAPGPPPGRMSRVAPSMRLSGMLWMEGMSGIIFVAREHLRVLLGVGEIEEVKTRGRRDVRRM